MSTIELKTIRVIAGRCPFLRSIYTIGFCPSFQGNIQVLKESFMQSVVI
jgi:hypothetical protein